MSSPSWSAIRTLPFAAAALCLSLFAIAGCGGASACRPPDPDDTDGSAVACAGRLYRSLIEGGEPARDPAIFVSEQEAERLFAGFPYVQTSIRNRDDLESGGRFGDLGQWLWLGFRTEQSGTFETGRSDELLGGGVPKTDVAFVRGSILAGQDCAGSDQRGYLMHLMVLVDGRYKVLSLGFVVPSR